MLGCGLWSLLLVDEQLTQPAAAAAGAGAPSDRDTSPLFPTSGGGPLYG
jgi:hypothetical protein